MEIKNANTFREQMVALLKTEKLLVDDLPGNLDNFIIALEDGKMIGAAGLEIYGDYGLLRSIAVSVDSRNKGIGGRLVSEIEALASTKNLKALCLLTETASDYFQQKGYTRINREMVPAALQASSEFSHACPQSAMVMQKILI